MEQSSCPVRNNEEIDSGTDCRGDRMLLIGTLSHACVFEWGFVCAHMCPCADADPFEPPQM